MGSTTTGAGGGSQTGPEGQGAPVPPELVEQGFSPGPLMVRTLLSHQYRASVAWMLGDAAAQSVAPLDDAPVNGFDAIGASELALSSAAVSAFESSALAAAQAAVADATGRARWVPCQPSGVADRVCFERVVQTLGRRMFRRQLTAEEVQRWASVAVNAATAYSSFNKGLEYLVTGLLQSPHFLYVVEVGNAVAQTDGWRELTPHELATRLSLLMTGATPTDALLDAADANQLDQAFIQSYATTAFATTQNRPALNRFFDEYLSLRAVPDVAKDPTVFPTFNENLARAMRNESTRLIEELVYGSGDFRELWTARHTYVDSALAQHYGLPAPQGTGLQRVELPANGSRAGLLGHGSVLSLFAHANSTSPTRRGKYVRERFLCQPVPEPPPTVDTSLSQGGTARTMREKLAQHQTDPGCAGCHRLMDNIGLALENYDGVGRYRTQENGVSIDATMSSSDLGTYTGPAQLGEVVASHPDVDACLVRNLFRYSVGHVESPGELVSLREVETTYRDGGHHFGDLIVKLASSEAFRYGTVRP